MKSLKTLAIALAAIVSLNSAADEVEYLNIILKNGKTVACKVSDIENIAFDTIDFEEHEYVDLGLESGLLWATCNIGASSPTEYGDYFACGEVDPKTEYNYDSYSLAGLSESDLKSMGILDGNGLLTANYDAASVNWGENWRMPSYTEFIELCNGCKWDFTTIDGVPCYKVTGTNGNYILLPLGGYMEGTTLNSAEDHGYYWTSYLDWDADGYYLYLSTGDYNFGYQSRKYLGYLIRPVYDDRTEEY